MRCGRVGAAAQVRCVSLEVLYERCAVHGTARCGGRCGSRGRCGKKGRARGLAHGSGEPASRFFCGALQLELVGARCAAPAALLPCESPPVPRRVRGVRGCNERGQRENPGGSRWGDALSTHLPPRARRGLTRASAVHLPWATRGARRGGGQ